MFEPINVLTLLIAPVLAYVAVALIFSLATSKQQQSFPYGAPDVRIPNGQN